VYHADAPEEKELALKIYKTSILIFKDRERYIGGEFRFRRGYCKGNPRKMVAVWAEKEVRNLKRLNMAGINSPVPLILKSNLIIMEFIGKDGKAAPRLKDAEIETIEEWEDIYSEVIRVMRVMYKQCRLVHADLSEYNMLYLDKKLYIIDVAQAVEHDHMNALSFLKRDCKNINTYFSRQGIQVITNKQLFEYVSTFKMKSEVPELLATHRAENSEKIKEEPNYVLNENGLFEDFEIPRSLMHEDLDKITGNNEIEDALSKICGVVGKDGQGVPQEDSDEESEESDEDSDDENEDEDKDKDKDKDEENNNEENKDETNEKKKFKKYDPFEGMTKQERQRKVKEENKDKRINKKLNKKDKAKIIKKTTCKRK